MIIRGLHAINVLKYAELHLENLPNEGLIAISGPNESGKSTIGETICFALFGRTFSLPKDDSAKMVRWGETQCSVTLRFSIKDETYELSRFLDDEGNHSARLTRNDDQTPLVRGVDKVATVVAEKLGFAFEAFIESFYLAQREITTPHPQSHAVKIMAGVAPMEQLVGELAAEIQDLEERLAELATETETAEDELAELRVDEGSLKRLEAQRGNLDQQHQANEQLGGALDEAEVRYLDRVPAVRSSDRAATWARAFCGLSLLLSSLGAVVWALSSLSPDLAMAQQLVSWLNALAPGGQVVDVPIVAYASAGLLSLALLFWYRAGRQRARADRLRDEASRLAEPLTRVRQLVKGQGLGESMTAIQGPDPVAPNPAPPPVLSDDDQFETPLLRIQAGRASAEEVQQLTDVERSSLKALLARQTDQLKALEQDIEIESERRQQAAKLFELLESLDASKRGLLDRIGERRLAIELLEGAARQSSKHFNRDIRDLVGGTLPLFTAGRYEHLKISETLTVQVFSAEKRDFLELDEVSSGTQRQIMLALRLALSEKLLNSTVKGSQFAFLDEPFAFFDAGRTRKALEALNKLPGGIAQKWIVAQSFPEDVLVPFAANIRCAREIDSLELVL